MIYQVTQYMQNRALKKEHVPVDRVVTLKPAEEWKSVCLFFQLDNWDREAWKSLFSFYLEQKAEREVNLVLSLNEKVLPDFMIAEQQMLFVLEKDLNWYKFPKEEILREFDLIESELLIDLSRRHNPIFEKLITRSKAALKIGCHYEKQIRGPYDIIVEPVEKHTEFDHFDIVLHYINELTS